MVGIADNSVAHSICSGIGCNGNSILPDHGDSTIGILIGFDRNRAVFYIRDKDRIITFQIIKRIAVSGSIYKEGIKRNVCIILMLHLCYHRCFSIFVGIQHSAFVCIKLDCAVVEIRHTDYITYLKSGDIIYDCLALCWFENLGRLNRNAVLHGAAFHNAR